MRDFGLRISSVGAKVQIVKNEVDFDDKIENRRISLVVKIHWTRSVTY